EALREKGIPSVTRSNQSVWDTAQADELERVLRAMASPASLRLRRAAAATELAGLNSDQVRARGGADEGDALECVADWLLELRAALDKHGPVSCVRAMLDRAALPGREGAAMRLLARTGGERAVTNLLHLAELLGREWRTGVRSADELAAHMSVARMERADDPQAAEELQQRLESDGSAVRLQTVHVAKGLEWPVVWAPMYAMAGRHTRDQDRGAVASLAGEGRVLAVGGPELVAATNVRELEERREQFRLMYVALTRARHRCNVVWAPAHQHSNAQTPFGALLHGRNDATWEDAVASAGAALNSVDRMRADLHDLAARARTNGLQGVVLFEELPVRTRAKWKRPSESASLVAARELVHALPSAARTTSFTGLTRSAHEGTTEARIDARVRSDDAQGGESAAAVHSGEAPLLSRQVLPAGPSYGDLVHRILEEGLTVLGEQGVLECANRACAADGARVDGSQLGRGLQSIARQPLLQGAVRGVDTGTATLEQLGRGVVRVELEYLLPAGTSARPLTVQAIARALERGGDVARRYAPSVAALTAGALHGHLTGFIDLACEHRGKWYVLDYKTNALGTTLDAFVPERLDDAMISSHYVLQYHLYSLAVHRWLRTRMPEYSYERHFGGALYLFVRAMGESRPAGSGVFADRPSLELIDALDGVFRGGAA
ncbi:MAG: PD-(D/E)XK nuclease family protein, partial [Phycisphaerae bacterium]|nr:PD-(D/E)XK nuclease family protein [Phycisphaerae bacterium]